MQVFIGLLLTGSVSTNLRSNLENFDIFVVSVPWLILLLAKGGLVCRWLKE